MGKIYPVGIVGESNYQPAIGRCRIGDPVRFVLEPANPYDALAIAVVSGGGETIGYIGRDSFVRELIHVQGQAPSACIKDIDRAPNGILGVVLDVDIDGDEAPGSRSYGALEQNEGGKNSLLNNPVVVISALIAIAFIAAMIIGGQR